MDPWTDQTFLMKYCDKNSPRFDSSVYVINCSSVVELKGVAVQGVTIADLVYKTYKHGRTRLWKGVVVLIASDTGRLQRESPPRSEADCVSLASTGSNSEARSSNIPPESNAKRSQKRKPKEAELQPKKKAKIGECTLYSFYPKVSMLPCCSCLTQQCFSPDGKGLDTSTLQLQVCTDCCWYFVHLKLIVEAPS